MKIFQHWAKQTGNAETKNGTNWLLTSWAGSNSSLQDASVQAQQKLADMAARLKQKGELDHYAYITKRVVRERVIEQYGNAGNPFAAITRNRYGALVLNAATVFFADVDLPVDKNATPDDAHKKKTYRRPVRSSSGFFARLFGRGEKTSYAELRAEQQQSILQRFAQFHQRYPSLDFRVYETAAGYRVIVTNRAADPQGHDSRFWLDALESDPLYRTLCEKQQCYRARLTPKPWRLPSGSMAKFFPDNHNEAEHSLLEWLRNYEEESRSFSVCQLIRTYGNNVMTEEAAEVVAIHDRYVLNNAASALA